MRVEKKKICYLTIDRLCDKCGGNFIHNELVVHKKGGGHGRPRWYHETCWTKMFVS